MPLRIFSKVRFVATVGPKRKQDVKEHRISNQREKRTVQASCLVSPLLPTSWPEKARLEAGKKTHQLPSDAEGPDVESVRHSPLDMVIHASLKSWNLQKKI